MSIKHNLIGATFGRLIVIAEVGRDKYKNVTWECVCSCGKRVVKTSGNLVTGHTLSCGCFRNERTKETNTKHGAHGTELYTRWASMIQRCENANQPSYRNYGGRGICVCDEWHDFTAFKKWAEGNGYQYGLSIERKDVNGDYCPSNCEWIPLQQQAGNTRRNRYIRLDGQVMNIADAARKFSIPYKRLYQRLFKEGWDIQRALGVDPHG